MLGVCSGSVKVISINNISKISVSVNFVSDVQLTQPPAAIV
jgi:hypothetical protein